VPAPDRAGEVLVQELPWGPVVPLMELTNWIAGVRQAALAVVVIALLFVFTRRGALLMALGSMASLWDGAIFKPLLHRPRPAASLVHVREAASGYSFPSGHATFYTWFAILLVAAVAPLVRRQWRPLLWAVAAGLILVGCLGRLWAGVHWPSDVAGGFLLSLAWVAIVYSAAGFQSQRPRRRSTPAAGA
jgi:membrane-associated phospholipid phosphatase